MFIQVPATSSHMLLLTIKQPSLTVRKLLKGKFYLLCRAFLKNLFQSSYGTHWKKSLSLNNSEPIHGSIKVLSTFSGSQTYPIQYLDELNLNSFLVSEINLKACCIKNVTRFYHIMVCYLSSWTFIYSSRVIQVISLLCLIFVFCFLIKLGSERTK